MECQLPSCHSRRRFIRTAAGLLVPASVLGSVPLPLGFFQPAAGSSIPANLYSGLIHAYMFNEGSGATVPDRIGGKDLTLQGSPTWTTQSGMTCIQLNGATQWLDTAAWSVGANNVTLVGWFYTTIATLALTCMFIEKETVNAQWELFVQLGGPLLRGGGTGNTPTGDGSGLPPNGWHQMGGTISSTTGKIYRDGADITVGSTTIDAFTDTSSALEIGRFSSGYYFNGFVGPVYIYNRALSASEVAQLYTAIYLY